MSNNISIKKATLINFIARYFNIIIQLVINSILARILTPDDYGIVAIISIFISFFMIIADMGIGPAIVQNKNLDEDDISSIFVFTLFIGIVISFLFGLFSYPLSLFYKNSVYIVLGRILSIGIFFNILNIVPNALMLKAKKFKILGVRNIVVTILGGILTVILGLLGFKYYALVINSVFISLLTVILNLSNCKIKFKIKLNIKSIKKIKDFSIYTFGFNFINYFARNLDNLLIGKFIGQVPLGYYDKSYKLMLYPVQNLTHVITPVLHPILSEYQNDKDLIFKYYIKIVRILSMLGIFFTVFCFYSSSEIIIIMFGNQWIQSIDSFKLLSISIWPQMVASSTGTIYQSLNETKLLYKTGLVTTFISVVFIIIGISLGTIEYVAVCISINYFLFFIILFYILIKHSFNKSYIKFLKIFKTHIYIFLIMSIGMFILKFEISNIFLSVIYKFLICLILFIISLLITKEVNIQYFRSKYHEKTSR